MIQALVRDPGVLRIRPGHLKVSGDGIFYTIQGEGRSIGKAAVFLRLHFCNLACSWCDTKYTWDRNLPEFWQESTDLSIAQAYKAITQFPARRLVITGGEPLLQQETVLHLVEKLPGWDIEFETNGTIKPIAGLARRCQFNVSPKLEHSGNSKALRYRPEVLERFNELERTTFKFVVQQAADFVEIDKLVAACKLDQSKIIIMPEGIDQEMLRQHALAVVEEVKTRGWRLLPRLHIMLWKAERRK